MHIRPSCARHSIRFSFPGKKHCVSILYFQTSKKKNVLENFQEVSRCSRSTFIAAISGVKRWEGAGGVNQKHCEIQPDPHPDPVSQWHLGPRAELVTPIYFTDIDTWPIIDLRPGSHLLSFLLVNNEKKNVTKPPRKSMSHNQTVTLLLYYITNCRMFSHSVYKKITIYCNVYACNKSHNTSHVPSPISVGPSATTSRFRQLLATSVYFDHYSKTKRSSHATLKIAGRRG